MHKPSQVEKYERNLKSGCSSIYAWEGLGKLSGWESSKAESPIAAARGQRLAAASWGWGGAFIAICSGKAMETRKVRWEVRLRGEENHFFQKKAYPEGHLLQEWHSKRPRWLGADISACWLCFAAYGQQRVECLCWVEWCTLFYRGNWRVCVVAQCLTCSVSAVRWISEQQLEFRGLCLLRVSVLKKACCKGVNDALPGGNVNGFGVKAEWQLGLFGYGNVLEQFRACQCILPQRWLEGMVFPQVHLVSVIVVCIILFAAFFSSHIWLLLA